MAIIGGVDYSKREQFLKGRTSSIPVSKATPHQRNVLETYKPGRDANWTSSTPLPPPVITATRSLPPPPTIHHQGGDGGRGSDYTSQYETELRGMQLTNALMMQRLGYDVTMRDGNLIYEKAIEDEETYLSPYGEYGTAASPFVYESDYMAARPGAYQQAPERYTYRPSPPLYPTYGYDRRQYRPRRNYYNNQRYYNNNYNRNRWYNRWRNDGYADRYNSRDSSRRLRSW